ncbi:MAG: lamin tail domain-containing protein, partial [Patescibacteria group bacterium]
DTKGNISDWVEKNINLTQKPIVFSEFAWAGTKASPSDEWIELYNITDYPVDLTGWKLYAADLTPDITFVSGDNADKITRNKIIEPHEYYLLERKNGNDQTDQTISNISADWWGSFGSGLNNGGEVMRLKNPAEFEVDKINPNDSSGWFAGNVSTRASMEKVVMEESGNDFRNWLTFSGVSTAQDAKGDAVLGSPKSENSVYNKYHQLNGTLLQNTILTLAKSPYWIYDILTVPENIKLTIEPGVIIKFTTGDGHQRIDIKGTLDVRGNEENKVVFTSFRDDEYGGDTNNDGHATEATQATWKYVHLFPQSKNNKINYAVFRYGGATFDGTSNDSGMLNVDNTSVDILGSVFEYARWKGLWAQNSLVNIENSVFQNSTSTPSQPFAYGSLYQDGGKVSISGTKFIDNRLAILASGNSSENLLSVKNSYFTRNKVLTQISIPVDFGNDNVVENNDYNGFLVSNLPVGLNITWGGNVPFIIPTSFSVPNTSQLTIKAVTTIKFKAFDSWFLAMGK